MATKTLYLDHLMRDVRYEDQIFIIEEKIQSKRPAVMKCLWIDYTSFDIFWVEVSKEQLAFGIANLR